MTAAKHLRLAIALAAFSIVSVSPALAQGKGKAKGKERKSQESAQVQQTQRERPTLQRRATTPAARKGEATSAALRSRSDDRNDRYEDIRRDDDERREDIRRDDDRRDDRYEDDVWGIDGRARRDVPRGWCQGKGNPHNTPENCGYRSDDRRYDHGSNDRYGNRGGGSYAEAHAAFHRQLDREYSARAAQRRTDPLYQIRLRADKAAEHERWHERTGTRH